MSNAQIDETKRLDQLRLWPGLVLVSVQWLIRFVLPVILPEATPFGAIGALLCGLAIVIWWAFFSRAPRAERWGAIAVWAVSLFVTWRLIDASIATAGMGVTFFMYAVPVSSLALVVWAAASRRLASAPRLATMVATLVLATGGWTLLRTDGITGGGNQDFAWRWAATSEERFLAITEDLPRAHSGAPLAVVAGADWPGFRGSGRDSIVHGVRIATDWSVSPPTEVWRRPIGPGWSSFAARGDRIYTQEQSGDDEAVSCYDLRTGGLIWRHRYAARFWESHAGVGPRATPALHDDRLYTLGATGILNALDAGDGRVLWSRNAASDAGANLPGWGFTSSPLVVGDTVVVNVGALAVYDVVTGEPRWFGPKGGSYSSPHLLTIDGVAQIVMQSGAGTTSMAPADGAVLWQHPWTGGIVQPAMTEDGDVLISASGVMGGLGIRRVAVARSAGRVGSAEAAGSGEWTAEERWTSNRLKPNFNDFVIHDRHAYGFDGSILASIDLADGERAWKGGRYGNGQLLLLADQDVLLVLSERGELALVAARPEGFTELARFPAIQGKTWNHPVLVGDLLLARNGQEMVAFRLALAGA